MLVVGGGGGAGFSRSSTSRLLKACATGRVAEKEGAEADGVDGVTVGSGMLTLRTRTPPSR